jgi:hypothetical protein
MVHAEWRYAVFVSLDYTEFSSANPSTQGKWFGTGESLPGVLFADCKSSSNYKDFSIIDLDDTVGVGEPASYCYNLSGRYLREWIIAFAEAYKDENER